ncbi:helix-turn-helix transcriptional regulator [Yinghuangia seranimata]|uniref:helix-turn-helix transcriptional regulator n=1 Tax=Yinghuangia seranimata TaxID=408067 RepID=UPI00248AB33F|nr:helix-turn-helix domain-containing protein [Yinghuangia seranimata]MDI2126952.1 helix-turn-helix domain-containing protein [Yinghuangia seranimata]
MSNPDEKLPLRAVLKEMGVSRAAFYRMRARGQAPTLIKMPNGHLRVRRAEMDRWWDGLEETA